MTPLERLDLAFRISDFALSLQGDRETLKGEQSSIEWIELDKFVFANDEGNITRNLRFA